MVDETLSFIVMSQLQSLANEGELSDIDMVTGFTLCVEGVDSSSHDQVLTIAGPYDYITKTLGHVEYLRISVSRQAGTGDPLD